MSTYKQDIKSILATPIVSFIIFSILSLLICALYVKEGDSGFLHKLQITSQSMLSPISKISVSTNKQLVSFMDFLDSSEGDTDTIASLKAENAKLKQKLETNNSYKEKTEHLQELLDMKNKNKLEGITCSVIGKSNSTWNRTISINAGSNDGIYVGQSVVCYGGVVGQVVSCSPNFSNVRLLSDVNSGIAVKISSRDNSYGILRGSLDGMLYIEDIDSETTIEVGDNVVTSGMGGSYKEGLIVGSVSQIIQNSSGNGRKIVIDPSFSTNSVNEVLVVNN